MKELAKSNSWLIGVLIVAVCLATLPAAAGQGAATFMGKIKDVDLQEQSVVVGSPDGDVVVYIDKESKITADGEAKKLADINVGMVVKVVYTMAGEDKIAESLLLLQ